MKFIAVALGGFIGAITRYICDKITPSFFVIPVNTMIINLLGCLILGWFLTISLQHRRINEELRLLIGTGIIGSFTTFSTFSLETIQLIEDKQMVLAMVMISVTIIGGIALTAAGVGLAKLMTKQTVRTKS